MQNTLTHNNAYPKYKIESVWTPPKNFVSDIVFRATVVQSKNVFWTAIDSEPIEISSNPLAHYTTAGRLNTFNIHNPDSVPSGYVLNKDGVTGASPYHVAMPSAAMTPPSPFLTVSQQSLVQRYPPHGASTHRDHLYYLDYNVCSRKLCLGLPDKCLRKRNCIMLLTAAYVPYTDGTVEFEIIADHKSAFNNQRLTSFGLSSSIVSTPAYYSVAFSHDRVMGQ